MLRELFQDTAQNPDEQSHNELPHLVEGDIQPGDSLEDGVEEVQGEAGRAAIPDWFPPFVVPTERN